MFIAACGPSGRELDVRDPGDITSAAARTFIDAIERKDVETIQRALHAPLAYAGMWFPDASCTQQFPVATTLQADRFPAFAACLATLRLRPSSRRDKLFGVAVLEDANGFELAARFAFTDKASLLWFGYAGRRDPSDALPSITPAAFHALRREPGPPPAEVLSVLASDRAARGDSTAGAWIKICLDQAGAITGVHPILVSSLATERALSGHVRTWTMRPFMVNGRALPACALLKLVYPAGVAEAIEQLPLPIPASANGMRVDQSELKRLEGVTAIVPDDPDKLRIQQAKLSRVEGSYWYCVDEAGSVMTVNAIESTGLQGYDARIRSAMLSWRYRPYTIGGRPVPVCTTIRFVYNQRR